MNALEAKGSFGSGVDLMGLHQQFFGDEIEQRCDTEGHLKTSVVDLASKWISYLGLVGEADGCWH